MKATTHILIPIASILLSMPLLSSCNQNKGTDTSTTDSTTIVKPSDAASAADAVKKEMEIKTIEAFLKDIYTGGDIDKIFEDSWVKKHCTPEVEQMLIDEYEYDGGGYGSWIIGGWGAGEDLDTEFKGITHDDKYYYATIGVKPGGFSADYAKGERVIRFSINLVKGVPVIQSVEWIKDIEYIE